MALELLWFDRRFTFDQPVTVWPGVLERLRGTPARVEERSADLAPARRTIQPADGGWSAQEHMGHLLDLEPLWAGRLEDFLSSAEVMRPADLTNKATHEADHNAADIAELCAAFRAARAGLITSLEQLDTAGFALEARHPRLDLPMRLVDMCNFAAEHDDHHLARISEIISA